MRVGSYARVLDRPIAGATTPQRVVIQVAESLFEEVGRFPRPLRLDALVEDHSQQESERIFPNQGVSCLGVRETQPGLVLR